MALSKEEKLLFSCRGVILEKLFGVDNVDKLNIKLPTYQFKILDYNKISRFYNEILKFPTTVRNTQIHFPLLEIDPVWACGIYVDGYSDGIIRRVINYCDNKSIPYTFINDYFKVGELVISYKNNLFLDVFELDRKLSIELDLMKKEGKILEQKNK